MSPHFGLMDPAQLSRAEANLMRSRLHWRGGRRRLRQQKTAVGLVTLYDALLCGLRWYLLAHPAGPFPTDTELENEGYLFSQARQRGLVDDESAPDWIRQVAERALAGECEGLDQERFMAGLEEVLGRCEVLPFAESDLPPEDPGTY